jgi:hypothetical protein
VGGSLLPGQRRFLGARRAARRRAGEEQLRDEARRGDQVRQIAGPEVPDAERQLLDGTRPLGAQERPAAPRHGHTDGPPVARDRRPHDEPDRLQTVHEPGHRGRAHLLHLGELPDRLRAEVNERFQRGELRGADAARRAGPAEGAVEVYRELLQVVGEPRERSIAASAGTWARPGRGCVDGAVVVH